MLLNLSFQLVAEEMILSGSIVLALIAIKHNWVKSALSELSRTLISGNSYVKLKGLEGKIFIQPIFRSNHRSLRHTYNSLNQLLWSHTSVAPSFNNITTCWLYIHNVESQLTFNISTVNDEIRQILNIDRSGQKWLFSIQTEFDGLSILHI